MVTMSTTPPTTMIVPTTTSGWSVNHWDETMGEVMGATMSVPFDLLIGRKTYEIFAGHWPAVPESEGG